MRTIQNSTNMLCSFSLARSNRIRQKNPKPNCNQLHQSFKMLLSKYYGLTYHISKILEERYETTVEADTNTHTNPTLNEHALLVVPCTL